MTPTATAPAAALPTIPSAPAAAAPAPAPAAPASTAAGTLVPPLDGPPAVPSALSTGSVAAGLLLAALAAAALGLARRRRRLPRLVEVVETTSLGPKRALVVARLGDELLLLGSSEAGVALLGSRPAAVLAAAAAPSPLPEPAPATSSPLELLARWRRKAPSNAPAAPGFDALLAESVEDVELRRKLAAGQAGSVR